MSLWKLPAYTAVLAAITACSRAAELSPKSMPMRSPDGLFEAYQRPNAIQADVNSQLHPFGTRLYLRAVGMKSEGAILRINDRWMDQQWCPGKDLLGVENHWDGHASAVDVFEVGFSPDHRSVIYKLVFRSPGNVYDRQWTIDGWGQPKRAIYLQLEQRHEGILGQEHWPPGVIVRHFSFHIGTNPLPNTPGYP
jgi:hypothetical protein